ncbi:MAG: hypothetical protein JSS77_05640 [Acidobacteria bacterium]|nr:hypothetical protein [Acidobacteriota bacterium]
MKLTAIVALILLILGQTFAQTQFSPDIKRVAVFKNGYAFTFREAETATANGWAFTDKAPIGVLGTIWGYSKTPNVRVIELRTTETESEKQERVANMLDFLLANSGSRIRVDIESAGPKTRTFEGPYEIVSQLRRETDGSPTGRNAPPVEDLNGINGVSIAVKTDTGTVIFPVGRIEAAELLGTPLWTRPKRTSTLSLGIRTEGAAPSQKINLGIAALERGIRWIPAYRVEVKGSPIKEAKLELEANLINELADLNGAEVNFVVGVPHFLFQSVMSPLSINSAFAGVSGYFRESRDGSYSNALMTQTVMQADGAYPRDDEAQSPTLPMDEKLNSFSAEQLYLYRANSVTLKKNEHSSLRLFSLTVPCTEVFEWTISDGPSTAQKYMNGNSNFGAPLLIVDLSDKIWFALRLKNTTEMPWTTAPAITFRDWKPIGQDMLTFTPIDQENILRVTPATEVIGDHNLEEVSRERVQLQYSGSNYAFDLVTLHGTLNLKNLRKDPVEMVITRNLVGEILSATDSGSIRRKGLNLQMVNPNSVVKWALTLPPGEKQVTYDYKVYIRR